MTTGDRHHYVPQSYLRNFAGPKEQIEVYDIRRRSRFKANVAKVAVEHGFYDMPGVIEDEDLPNELRGKNRVEAWFSKVETTGAKLLEELRQRAHSCHRTGLHPSIPNKWRESLAYLVYLQRMRTREERRRHRDGAESLQTAVLRKIAELDPEFREAGIEPEDVRARLEEDAVGPSHIEMMLDPEMVGRVTETWRDKWKFYVARTNVKNPFITSDSPVVANNHAGGPRALLVKYMEFCLPLDPLHALLIVEPTLGAGIEPTLGVKDGGLMRLSAEHVTFYNSLQIFQCFAQVYAKRPTFELVDDILEANPKLGTPEWDSEHKGALVNGERILD